MTAMLLDRCLYTVKDQEVLEFYITLIAVKNHPQTLTELRLSVLFQFIHLHVYFRDLIASLSRS